MKIVTNHKIVKRNSRIGSFSMIGALVVLAGGFIVSLGTDPNAFPIALIALAGEKVEDVAAGVNAYMRRLRSQGAIAGGECWADKELNTKENIFAGRAVFSFDFSDTPPAERVTFRSLLFITLLMVGPTTCSALARTSAAAGSGRTSGFPSGPCAHVVIMDADLPTMSRLMGSISRSMSANAVPAE